MSNEESGVQVMGKNDITSLERIERAQIDSLVSTAKAYPRDPQVCRDKAIAIATMDQETAQECFYVLRRGGNDIEGPSIRCAEIVASTWQNIRAGSRVLEADDKTISAQAFCHDTENNVFIVKETKRRITDKNGKRYNDDMIVMTGNAAAAVALRNAVFGTVPKAVVRAVYLEAKKVAVGGAKTLAQRLQRVLKLFAGIPVSEAQILVYLDKISVAQITPDDLGKLQGVFNALKEGEQQVDDIFPPIVEDKPEVAAGEPVKKPTAAEKKAAKAEAKAAKEEPEEPVIPDPPEEPDPDAVGDGVEPPEDEPEETDGGPFAAKKTSDKDQTGMESPE